MKKQINNAKKAVKNVAKKAIEVLGIVAIIAWAIFGIFTLGVNHGKSEIEKQNLNTAEIRAELLKENASEQ